MKKLIAIAGTTMLMVGLTGCGAAPFTKFTDAYETCGSPSDVQVSDNGTTISVDTIDEYDYTGYMDFICVVKAVGTPQYIQDEMGVTTAMMGRQSATFNGIDVSWSYHPDNGINVVFHKN